MKHPQVLTFLIILVVLVTLGSWSYLFLPKFFNTQKFGTIQLSYTPAPTPQVFYMVKEGSLYRWAEDIEPSLFVDKSVLKHERLRTYGVNDYAVSPDGKKIALFVEAGVDEYLVFLVNADGNNPTYIDTSNVVEWAPDSLKFAYANRPASIGPSVMHVYDLKNEKISETELQKDQCYMSYPQFEWKDPQTLHAHYQCFDDIPYGDITEEGDVDIKINELKMVQ